MTNYSEKSSKHEKLIQDIQFLRRKTLEEPEVAVHYFDLGVALSLTGDYEQAMNAYKKAIDVDPKNVDARYNLAISYQNLGFTDRAITTYEDTLIAQPENDEAWCNLGVLLYNKNKIPQAIKCYQRSVQINPDNLQSCNNIAIATYLSHDFQAAVEASQNSIKLDDNNPSVWSQLGLGLYSLQKYSESEKAYLQALELRENHSDTWNNLGNCHLKLGKFNEAEKDYQKSIALQAKNPTYWFNLGELFFNQGAMQKCVPCFKKVVSMDKDDAESWLFLGRAQKIENPREAISCFEKAKGLHIRVKGIQIEIAELKEKLGLVKEAMQLRKMHYEANPYNLKNNVALGQLYLKLGKLDQAWECINPASNSREVPINTWQIFSAKFRMEKEEEEEIFCLEKILKLDSKDDYSWIRLGVLALGKNLAANAEIYFQKSKQVHRFDSEFWIRVMTRFIYLKEFKLVNRINLDMFPVLQYSPKLSDKLLIKLKKTNQLKPFICKLFLSASEFSITKTQIISLEKSLSRINEIALQESVLKSSLDLYPNDKQILESLISTLVKNSKIQEIIELLNSNPQLKVNQKVFFGVIQFEKGNLDDAKRTLTAIEDAENQASLKWIYLSKIALKESQPQIALDWIQKATDQNPPDEVAWFQKAIVLESLDQIGEAKLCIRKAVKINKFHHQSWCALGIFEMEGKQYKKAKQAFLKSHIAKPDYIPAYKNLAILFEEIGETEKRESCLEALDKMVCESGTDCGF